MEQFFTFVANHWFLWLVFFGLLAFIIQDELNGVSAKGRLEPFQAVNLINHKHAVVCDIRSNELFGKDHVINATNVSAEELDNNKYQKKHVVLMCENGNESVALLAKLQKKGFEHIYAVNGGMTAWRQAELPTTSA